MVFNVSPTTSSFGVTIGSSTGAGAGAACGCGVCGAGVVALALALPCGGRARSGVLTGCFGPSPETLEAFHVKTWHRNAKIHGIWHVKMQLIAGITKLSRQPAAKPATCWQSLTCLAPEKRRARAQAERRKHLECHTCS